MYESIKTPYPISKGYLSVEQTHNITILTTGGTIDKSYDESDGSLKNRSSMIEDTINRGLALTLH